MAFRTSKPADSVNVLAYLRSKSSVDYDALDLKVATELGPFADCTSNQWESYIHLSDPRSASVIEESLVLARRLRPDFSNVSVEELAVEIAMIRLSLRVIPLITGSVYVMCNPLYSWNTDKIVETGHRFHRLCHIIDRSFDLSRLIMKVPATWEGLQACRRLKGDNVKTLATTLFTMEQAILAGEAGCTSVSPFAYDLRAHLDTSYHDSEPVLELMAQAQQYYRQHGISTKVKSCCFMNTDEVVSMAGVDAMTLPAEMLGKLASMTESKADLETRSVFQDAVGRTPVQLRRLSYINDRLQFDRIHATNGRGKAKTEDSIAVFCGFQLQMEALMTISGGFKL